MKITISILMALAFSGLAVADQAQSTITISMDGLGCSTQAGSGTFTVQGWAFGATNPTTTSSSAGASGAGKVKISTLTLTRSFDECSAALFALVTSGKHVDSLTLTQTAANTKQTEMTVKLLEVFVTDYQIGGNPASLEPAETVNVSFNQITITNPANRSQASWNLKTNSQ
jgi:type VI secretion system Hcp family effector